MEETIIFRHQTFYPKQVIASTMKVWDFVFIMIELQEITEETLLKVKSMPRLEYSMYSELISQGQIKKLIKLKNPRTIFVDEINGLFYYLNPLSKELVRCGEFRESEATNE